MSRENKLARCETCQNCIPIGDGDHICNECGDMTKMVISDYAPTDEYLECGDKNYE